MVTAILQGGLTIGGQKHHVTYETRAAKELHYMEANK
jgi:hypothetical protein